MAVQPKRHLLPPVTLCDMPPTFCDWILRQRHAGLDLAPSVESRTRWLVAKDAAQTWPRSTGRRCLGRDAAVGGRREWGRGTNGRSCPTPMRYAKAAPTPAQGLALVQLIASSQKTTSLCPLRRTFQWLGFDLWRQVCCRHCRRLRS